MINFFRRIRKKLVANNKLVKYLVYASGEIVLIVIGILIALSLNNRNEQRKTEARIDQIFHDVLDELVSNIEATRLPMRADMKRLFPILRKRWRSVLTIHSFGPF